MRVTNQPQPPQPPVRQKIGTQDYPANPALDKWAETAPIQTVPKFFKMAVEKNPDGKYIAGKVGKEYQFQTYREVEKQVNQFASGLIELGVKAQDRVAVFADNSPEWRVADYGICYADGILACVLAEAPEPRVEFILKDSESKIVLVDTKDKLEKLLKVEGNLPHLETIVVGREIDLTGVESSKKLVTLDAMMAAGSESLEKNGPEIQKRIDSQTYKDIGSIVYTSGSTGNPKGVLHSHGNVLSAVEGMLQRVNNNPQETLVSVRKDDLYPSILPLTHVMGRVADYAMTAEGGAIAYPGSIKNFTTDLKTLKPSVLAVTPLFLHKVYDGIENKALAKTDPVVSPFLAGMAAGALGAGVGGTLGALAGAQIAGGVLPWVLGMVGGAIVGGATADKLVGDKVANLSKAEVFQAAVANSKAFYESHGNHTVKQRIGHELAKKFVFSDVKEQVDQRMGGNVRLMMSGGAPLSGEAETVLRAAGYGIAQGYGLAETAAGGLMNNPATAELGTGGASLPCNQIRLAEGNEIQISGPTIMTGGYLNRDDKTKEAFTDDGWFRTGDTGKVVKVTGPVSRAKLAGFTAAGGAAGAVLGGLLGHSIAGAAVAALATAAVTVFTGAARTEGEDHYVITGRMKSQFKLPGGEYVSPEPIEASLQSSPYIARALVTGAKNKDLVGALIQPNFEPLQKWAAERGLPTEPAEMIKHPEVIKLFDTEAQQLSSTFQKHEVVRKVTLLDKELGGDEVTTKGEVMRSIVTERYQAQIDAMFA